jgi:ABC-2 type transport system permease protein
MRASLERILVLVRKEFLQIFRDPRLVRVIFLAPVIQLVVFGYAVSTDVRHTATFVVDLDQSRASRDLLSALTAGGYFEVVGRSDRPADLVRALDHGEALMGIVIPRGFAADVAASGPQVQLLFDGTNSNIANVARGYAERIVQSFAASSGAAAAPPRVELSERAWYNPDLASRNYNVPAVVGTIMMLVCLLLTSLAVVREREVGTLEQLMVSPLKAWELVAGKTLPFALIGLADLLVITGIALVWFKVPFVGSFPLLLAASVLYLLSGLGVGLLISTVSRTQQEAFMATFLLVMPIILLSGFMFPVASMPLAFRWLTLANPMRHFLEVVRGVFLKGAGLDALWRQLLALLALGLTILSVAVSRFHKRAA